MTNSELLRLAAKAIDSINWQAVEPFDCDRVPYWNPLTNDGDRYRLAKKLDIRIHFGPCYVTYTVAGNSRLLRWPDDVKDDAYAIVRAAAEIGKTK